MKSKVYQKYDAKWDEYTILYYIFIYCAYIYQKKRNVTPVENIFNKDFPALEPYILKMFE